MGKRKSKKESRAIVFLLFLIIIGFIVINRFNFKSENIAKEEVSEKAEVIESSESIEQTSLEESKFDKALESKIKLAVIGDIMCHNTQIKDAYKNGAHDFSYVFEDVKEHIQSADLAIR